MLVIGLLGLYAAFAAGCIVLARAIGAKVRVWSWILLIAVPLGWTGRAALTGNVLAPLDIAYQAQPLFAHRAEIGVGAVVNPIISDVVYQGIPWQKAVREALKNGRVPLWNRFVLAGEPLLAVQQHGMLHPTFWMGLPLPLAQAWTLSMTLRVFLALLCAYLFFRDLELGEIASLLGASGWALCDFLVFFAGYPLNPTVGPFPLLLLGLRRLAREPGRRPVAICLGALLLMATGGHPESLLHCVAGAGVYFLFELAWANRGVPARAVALSLAAGALALGLSTILFLPFREAVTRTAEYRMRVEWYAKAERSVALPVSLERSIKCIVPYAFGSWRSGGEKAGFAGPAGYAGAILLPLAIVGLFSARRERWPFLIMVFLGFSAWARLPVVNDAICKLPLFDVAINEYLVMLGAFGVTALSALGMDDLVSRGRRGLALTASALSIATIGLLYAHVLPNLERIPQADRTALLAVQVVPIAILAVACLFSQRTAAGKVLPAALLVLFLAERGIEMGSFYPTTPRAALAPPLPFLRGIPRHSPSRMAAVANLFIPNIAALYEIEDVRGYEAMTFAPLAETFPLWCVPQPVWFNRIDEPTKPFLSFLNVRYVLAPPGYPPPRGWRLLGEDPGGRLLENPNALARVFVPHRVYLEKEPGRQRERLFAIRDFAAQGVAEAAAPGVFENGNATVRMVFYDAQRMEVSVNADRESLIATSVTGWPGWRLEIDGQERPLLAYNRAFLAFQVPAGRHRAVLRYWPRSFVAGLWISGLSALCAIAYFFWPRRAPSASARSAATGEKVLAADQPIQEAGSPTGSM